MENCHASVTDQNTGNGSSAVPTQEMLEQRPTAPSILADRLRLPPALERLRDVLERVQSPFAEQRAAVIAQWLENTDPANRTEAGFDAALESLENERIAAFAEFLTPAELAEVELLNSDNAQRLREETRDLDLTVEELRSVVALEENGVDMESRSSALREMLGDLRAGRLELNQSPDYRFFDFLAQRSVLSDAQRDQAYSDHRDLLLGQLKGQWNEEAWERLKSGLGEAGFHEYQNWIERQVDNEPMPSEDSSVAPD